MSNDQLPTDEHPGVDPTNASLAAQNRKILQGLARLEKLIEDPSPTPVEIANQIDDALREDAELETPKFSDFGRFYLSQLVLEIRCPIRYAPPESSDPDPELKADAMDAARDVFKDALAEVFGEMLPDGETLPEIPEGWAPVVLAINPMTGEFITIAGPRSEPDGRIEPLETMLARQIKSTVGAVVSAVREAGRPQPKPLANLEGSCPICRLGEVGKLGDDFECAKCGCLFCGKCGGVKGPAHENVNACSCEGRTL